MTELRSKVLYPLPLTVLLLEATMIMVYGIVRHRIPPAGSCFKQPVRRLVCRR